ncbi:hypothetical protein BCR44DRAFT_1020717 [Catenaria anguillulae PL171]|uniref:Uncharacterized protein n=1 Tax=Catenaria anguillulae PL171 TaxID=765915 RepID=A0A1Y2H665_9FUNG|nr:hypothetical protein BCR44DRAFT_1020717 [Catenaria anguillulae PL171]
MRSSIASPATEKSGMRIILTINGTRVYETISFSDMGDDAPSSAMEHFTMAGQSFQLQCIPTMSRQVFYVNHWRFVAPALLLATGAIVSVALGRFLRQSMSIRETTADIQQWMDNSQTILQAAANPMLVIDNNGKISVLASTGTQRTVPRAHRPFLKRTS